MCSLKLYRPTLQQGLNEEYPNKCLVLQVVYNMRWQKYEADKNFYKTILWTNQATFIGLTGKWSTTVSIGILRITCCNSDRTKCFRYECACGSTCNGLIGPTNSDINQSFLQSDCYFGKLSRNAWWSDCRTRIVSWNICNQF